MAIKKGRENAVGFGSGGGPNRSSTCIASAPPEPHGVEGPVTFDYVGRIGDLADDRRLHFYEVLAHNLTVAARMVWSGEALTDAEKVTRLKWLNELLHGVTAKVYAQRLRTHEWTEADSYRDILHYTALEPGLSRVVGWAILASYEAVTGQPAGAAERLLRH